MLPHPPQVKHLPINRVPHLQHPILQALHHPRQLQVRLHQRLLLIQNRLLPPQHLPIHHQPPRQIRRTAGQHIPHKLQIRILLTRRPQKNTAHHLRHPHLRPVIMRLLPQGLAQPLRQIRMPPRPRQHPPQHLLRFLRGRGKPLRQQPRLLKRKISQIDPLANIKRRPLGVTNQVAGSGHAKQHKRQPGIFRVLRPSQVKRTDGDKKIIGEIQIEGGVNLIHKNNDPLRHLRQHHILNKLSQPLGHPQLLMGWPPLHQLPHQPQLSANCGQQSQMPGFRIQLNADHRQIHRRRANPLRLQHRRRLHHQTRLAHLARRQHIGKRPTATQRQQFLIRLPGEVNAAPGLHLPPRHKRH